MAIPQQVASVNGIVRGPKHGLLNVLVSQAKGNATSNTRANVRAFARDLTGQKRDIPTREIVANGSVTYLGTYDVVTGEVIDFVMEAVPLGSERKLSLTFRDRLWPSS